MLVLFKFSGKMKFLIIIFYLFAENIYFALKKQSASS